MGTPSLSAPSAGPLSPKWASRVRGQGPSGLGQSPVWLGCCAQGRHLWRGHGCHPLCLWAAALGPKGPRTLCWVPHPCLLPRWPLTLRACSPSPPEWGREGQRVVQAVPALLGLHVTTERGPSVFQGPCRDMQGQVQQAELPAEPTWAGPGTVAEAQAVTESRPGVGVPTMQ